ncbi:hypothetical protein FRB90_000882, partial [Tulasnella sp. 427]
FDSDEAAKLEPPSEDIINDVVATLVKSLHGLKNEINILDAALIAIGNNILARSAVYKKKYNEMLPIHRLPPELFTTILLIDLRENPPRRSLSRRHRLWQLALVSSKWQKTVALNPIFWTDIHFRRDDPNLCLRKSQNALLNIKCDTFYQDVDDVEEFLETVATAAHRWRSIALSCNSRDFLQKLPSATPQLTDVQINVRAPSNALGGQEELKIRGLVKLQHVCLVRVGLEWESLNLERLLSLQLSHLGNIVPDLDWLLTILQRSPQLEQLALSNVGIASDSIPHTRTGIRLLRLKSLQLTTLPERVVEYLLSVIDCPHLTAIKLVGFSDANFAAERPSQAFLKKLLPSVLKNLDDIGIRHETTFGTIEVISHPIFGLESEWMSWAASPHAGGLHITSPTENYGKSLERIITLLSASGLYESTSVLVTLSLQEGAISANELSENQRGGFNPDLLAKLPTLTYLAAVDPTDVRAILQHLGECQQKTDGVWGYSCPQLKRINIEWTNEEVTQENIDVFIAGRYGDGEPFYRGNQLVKRPPSLDTIHLPMHLEQFEEEDLDLAQWM